MLLDSSVFYACTGGVMTTGEPATANDRSGNGVGTAALGGLTAFVLTSIVLGILAIVLGAGADDAGLARQPVFLGICLAVSATLGWRLGPMATDGGWRRAVAGGVVFGASWPLVTTVVAYTAVAVDGVLRGLVQPGGLESPGVLIFGLAYGVLIFEMIGTVYLVPLGLLWALAIHAAARLVDRQRARRRGSRRAATLAFVLATATVAVAGGAARTLSYSPWATRCLDLPGGQPTAAAFSPAGDLLAITAHPATTTQGEVDLLEWPSGRLLGRWSAWVDRAIAVAPDGQVYWSAADGSSATNGIQTARAGSPPAWFTAPNGGSLTDMAWTSTGLRGIATDVLALASVPFAGDHSAIVDDDSSGAIAALWVAPDGSASAIGQFGPSATIVVRSPEGTVSIAAGDVQSIAVSADRQRIIAAEASGGLVELDISSGRSRQLMPGSQQFVALSERGDIAWLNDEAFGAGRLCTSSLARLGG